MHRASTFLRSESRRIDETALAESSTLVNSESSPPLAPKRSSPASSHIGGEGVAFCTEGLHIEIGRTFKGGSTTLLEEPLARKQRMSDTAHPPPRTPRPKRATLAPSPKLGHVIPAPRKVIAEPILPASGPYPGPRDCSQKDPEPWLYASLILHQQLDTSLEFSPSWLHSKRSPRRSLYSRGRRRSRKRGTRRPHT